MKAGTSALIFFAIAACSDAPKAATMESQQSFSVVAHDDDPNNTIRIPAASMDSVPRIIPTATMMVSEGSNYAIAAVQSIATDAERNTYILDNMSPAVLVFDSTGNLLRKIAGRGHGPGELMTPNSMTLSDDHVFVLDRGLQVFRRNGSFERTIGPATGFADAEPLLTAERVIMTSGGLFVVRRHSGQPTRNNANLPWTDTLSVSRLDLLFHKDPNWKPITFLIRQYEMGAGISGTMLMGARPIMAARQDGAFYFVATDSFHIDIVNAAGGRRHLVGMVPRVPTSTTDAASYVKRLAALIPPEAHLDMNAALHAPFAKFRPVIGQLVVSESGCIAIQRLDLTRHPYPSERGETSVWTFLRSDGVPTAQAEFPSSFTAWTFDDTTITGVIHGTDDIPSVTRFAVPRACKK